MRSAVSGEPLPAAQQLWVARAASAILIAAAASSAIGCGGPSRPRAEDIYHDPSLRRGSLDADDADRELLGQLDALPEGQPVSIAGRVYVPARPYHAASGRTCRPVHAGGSATRLACSTEDARWEFVPDVFGGDNPFAIEPPPEPSP